LGGYELPIWLAEEDSQSVADLEEISKDDGSLDAIDGLAAFAQNDQGQELILFQNFNRSHIIRPGMFLLLQHKTYETPKRPGFALAGKLSAIYLPASRKLLFQSFWTANTFLPLAEYCKEASEREIREILSHDLLAAEDPDALAVGANQWFRKRFAMLRDSDVLDEYTAGEILERSHGYDIDVHTSQGKVVFPAEKAAAKKLLQFLNEEIFRGAITKRLYETNSKREAD
jgi:hypothetical protein